MSLGKEQAKQYLKESVSTLEAAKILFKEAKSQRINLWAQVVKLSYDSMEQAVSAAIADKDGLIPKEHPRKISEFRRLYPIYKVVVTDMLKWLGRRSAAQYADIKSGKVTSPSESFNEKDAESALNDSGKILNVISEIIS